MIKLLLFIAAYVYAIKMYRKFNKNEEDNQIVTHALLIGLAILFFGFSFLTFLIIAVLIAYYFFVTKKEKI